MIEMEETNDVAIKSSAEEEVNSVDQGLHGPEAAEDTLPPVDYSHFNKKDFVDYLKQLTREPDLRKVDQALREVRLLFGNLQDKERSDALQRFVENGGVPDDFEFRTDAWDAAFEANFRVLRERKAEFIRNQEAEKQENFRKKSELLEELRKLVDGEDNKRSFDLFKEIQQRWKATGAVPQAQVKPLWASYHVLVDRFYDNRNIYFELKELDRKKNLAAKIELCVRAEKLAETKKIGEAVKELNELHEEYRHIGPVPREEKDALWERFKKASDSVYARRDTFVAALHREWTENLALKEQVIAEAAQFAEFQSDQVKEWNKKTQEILALQKRWEGIGAVARNQSKEINRKFWSSFKTFYGNKGKFFKKLDESRQANLKAKQALLEKATALRESQDQALAVNEVKRLQAQWKEIGPVPEKVREKIFQEFKAACDFFFERKRAQQEESEKVQAENLLQKESICAELEKAAEEKTGTLEQLKEWQRKFHAVGFVPRSAMASIRDRFTAGTEKLLGSINATDQEKEKVLLEIQVENIKTDPEAGQKLYAREQGLRKKISKAENELATLRNNLEFFGRSKNADKMREEFNVKIAEAAKELDHLKQQLKILRAAH